LIASDTRPTFQFNAIDVDITDDKNFNQQADLSITSLCDSCSSFDGRVPSSGLSCLNVKDNQVILL
jgi:hypothetical protein